MPPLSFSRGCQYRGIGRAPARTDAAGGPFHEFADGDIVIRQLTEADLAPAFHMLLQTNPKFLMRWNWERSDLTDHSLSGYEQSLANLLALQGGFSPQAIVDVLVVFRIKWKGGWRGKSHYRATLNKSLAIATRHRRERRQGAFRPPDEADDHASAQAPGAPYTKSELLEKLNRAYVFIDPDTHQSRLRIADVRRAGSHYTAITVEDPEIYLGNTREMNLFNPFEHPAGCRH
jgi:hypothetical protein